MAVDRHRVEPNALDPELQEHFGANVADAPKLCLAGAHLNDRFDLAVDRDDLIVLTNFGVLEQQQPLRQAADDREQPFKTVDHESAGHSAQDLLVDAAVGMRVIPEEARTLAAGGWHMHLVIELLTRMDVNEHVVAVALP